MKTKKTYKTRNVKNNTMFTVRLAELNIAINNKYEYVKALCNGYIVEEKADFFVEATERQIEAERKSLQDDAAYLESLAVYRQIATKIVEFDGFLLHAAVISVQNNGIAFLAKSGTGKTTHLNLWRELLVDKVTVVNGDKPLLRFVDGKLYAYGTPWAGKEALNTNTKTELKNICFISRAQSNECTLITDEDIILEKLFSQTFLPKTSHGLKYTLDFFSKIMNKCSFYSIKCNTDITAAKTAYQKILLSQDN